MGRDPLYRLRFRSSGTTVDLSALCEGFARGSKETGVSRAQELQFEISSETVGGIFPSGPACYRINRHAICDLQPGLSRLSPWLVFGQSWIARRQLFRTVGAP